MLLPLEHFSLQLAYAHRAAQMTHLPLEQALMEFTQYWRRINNASSLMNNHSEWSFDPTTPDWHELRTRLQKGEPADHIAYELYRRSTHETDDGTTYFGCFRFDFMAEYQGDSGVIKLHFHNRDHSGYGPLSKQQQSQRLQDLKSMFASIKHNFPQARVVIGGSWLYNVHAYTRLFPPAFTINMTVEKVPFPRSSGIWGQFLDSEGAVKPQLAGAFLLNVNQAQTVDQLLDCFPFKILFPRAKIEDFYQHFDIPLQSVR